MKTYIDTDLPIELKYDLEMMKQLVKAKDLYATYNAIILYQDIDPSIVLKPFILQESFKACELTGNKISQSSLYYLRYNPITDDTSDILNYNKVLLNIEKYISPTFSLSMGYLHKIHKDLNNSVRGKYHNPGKLRDKMSWIGKRGSTINTAEFVPLPPRDIPFAMGNFIKYFNKRHAVDQLIEIAISHAQFENIHPYKDANGRLGRILIPIQAYLDGKSHISLFISDSIKQNEYTYYKKLKDTRNGNWESYVKFFLQMMITQLESNISKLNEINRIYKKDSQIVIDIVKEKNGKKVYDYIFSNITFTIKEISTATYINYQTIRNYINKLFQIGLIAKHKVNNGEYVYTYIKMYNLHVPVDWL